MQEKMRVSDYIPSFFINRGVKDFFNLSGGGIMHLTDGLACNDEVNIVCLHHEQATSMAIEAYTKYSGNMVVGYFTTGPGGTNSITGLAGAWLDSVPCMFISGQVKRKESVYHTDLPEARQIGVQEINIIPIVESLTKYTAFVDKPEDIRYHLEKAIYLSKQGRPGPVWLDIPSDVQGALIEPDKLKPFQPNRQEKTNVQDDILEVKKYLQSAKRPIILAGQGVRLSGAMDSLSRLALKYQIPIVTTFLGIDVIESDHPCYVGRIGIKGDRAGNFAIQNSDLFIAIGTSLPVAEIGYEYNFFAREAKKVVVDIDLSAHKKNTIKIDHLIECDAKKFLDELYKCLDDNKQPPNRQWHDICLGWRKKYPVCLPQYAEMENNVNIYYFVENLSQKLKSNDVVVTDAGSAFYAGSQAIKIKKGMRYITSGGFATMGYGLPASIGVCVASGNRRVMCITGDGSFQQNIQELQTINHYNYPIKIFILNNEGYLSIRATQKKYYNNRLVGEGPQSGVSFPDSEKVALAYGIKFVRIKNNHDLGLLLDDVMDYDGPIICEVMTPKDQLIIPTLASYRKEDGTMISKPLEDMFPFLDRDEFKKEMIIDPVDEST